MFRQLLFISLSLLAINASNDSEIVEKANNCDGCGPQDLTTSTCNGCGPRLLNKCYKVFCGVQVNWFGANSFCNSIGMRLATVENAQQNNAVLTAIQNSACPVQADIFLWIGATNLVDGRYIWLPTGDVVIYQSFLPGEPNNLGGVEHCLEYRQGGWNDRDCNAVQRVICESVRDCSS